MEEKKLNAEEQLAKIKEQRHAAWKRWYQSEKGAAWRAKKRKTQPAK